VQINTKHAAATSKRSAGTAAAGVK
jgi:hypothetical protein